MDRSQNRVVVHFSTNDPSRDFSNLTEAIDFLGGSDWRCLSGRAWIEDPGLPVLSSLKATAIDGIFWPPFSPEHSTLLH